MPSKGGIPYYIAAECGRSNYPLIWLMASLLSEIIWVLKNVFLHKLIQNYIRLNVSFMQLDYHNTIKGNVEGIIRKH